jgi:F420-non-reducing hydrogenase iron-sulfur subunit
MGIEPERVKLVWASAAEGVRLAHEIAVLVEEIRALGPLNWPKWEAGNGHLEISRPEAEEVPA